MKNILLGVLLLIMVGINISFAQPETTQKIATLFVSTLTCPICPITVKKSLEKVPGVIQVKIDFESKTAIVTYNPQKVEIKQLLEATTNAGFPAQIK